MFLKRRTRTKDGKTHAYYSVCESLRVSRDRVVQRQVLHLGELNTTQLDSWQHSIDVLHEDGQRRTAVRAFGRAGAVQPHDCLTIRVGWRKMSRGGSSGRATRSSIAAMAATPIS